MATYLVTGGTGFIGRRLLPLLLARPGSLVHVLVRPGSAATLAELARQHPGRLLPVTGDLEADGLGVDAAELAGPVDHLLHLGAVYDLAAPEQANRAANVGGTHNALAFARAHRVGRFHHVSSIAVAGDYRGRYSEASFDLGQTHPTPYHATKFAAEALVRAQSDTPYTVYRPAVVVGDSRTGQMDKVDGPYYLLPAISRLARLPARLPLAAPDLGHTSVVPVDYVAAALDHLAHTPAPSGATYHLGSRAPLSSTRVFNALAAAAGAPRAVLTAPGLLTDAALAAAGRAGRALGVDPQVAAAVLEELGVPAQALPALYSRVRFDTDATRRALRGSGIEAPDLEDYAPALYRYWARHLDPERARRRAPRGSLAGRRVVVTGASSGIGRATALAAARLGAEVVLLARRADELEAVRQEVAAAGGAAYAYPCDLVDPAAVDAVATRVLAERGTVDMLVNNAGRSIRRSVLLTLDRAHDLERTMSVNYLGAMRLTFALLPGMVAQRYGRVVNVTTEGLQFHAPRFSAYLASKAALDEYAKAAGRELLADGVSFCNVRMPLVRTPMIAPARAANRSLPKRTPEEGAELVLRALAGTGEEVGTRAGTVVAAAQLLAPTWVRTLVHLAAYQAAPETAPEAAAAPRERPAVAVARAATRLLWRGL